jgi:hypothetical protein
LERDEAVEVLERIIESCATVDGQYVALMPPNLTDPLSHDYQIHLRTNIRGMERKCLENIINNHNLVWHETEDKTIIYKQPSK